MFYVNELMTRKVFSLLKNDSLSDVRTLMNLARIRHIPVTDTQGAFLGLVTHRDLLSYAISYLAEIGQEEQHEIESAIMVSDIMRTNIVTTTADTLLRDAARTLYENKYGCLPVVDEKGFLVGIITEADFLRLSIMLLQDA